MIHVVIFRNELENLLEEEKGNVEKLDCEKKEENEKLKSELEFMRIELDEKNKSSMEMRKVEEEIRVKGRDGLSGRLREDFDKIVDDYKVELEKNYQREKETLQKELEYQCQAERQRVQEDLEREKKKLNDDIAREREDLEKTRKKNQEDMETKAKEESRFLENHLKYNDDYSGNYGVQQGRERWRDDKEHRDYERGQNDYSPSREHSRKNDEGLSASGSNENGARREEARYRNSSFSHSFPGKMQVECENPSLDSNDPRYAKNDFSQRHFLASDEKDRLDTHSYKAAPYSKDLYYVTPGSENILRTEINELRRENQGLKAKIEAMEENIDLHRKYKAEAKEELSRLQKDKNELQSKLRDEDMEQSRRRNHELEEKLRGSEARGREFEAKIRELNEKLSKAEIKSREREPRGYPSEDRLKTDEPSVVMRDGMETCFASTPYHGPLNKDNDGDLNYEPHSYECEPVGQENVYGYPSETKRRENKHPHRGYSTASNCGGDSYRSSLNGFDPSKCGYSDRFGSGTGYPRVTRPDLYTSTTGPLYGSHGDQFYSPNQQPYKGKDYKVGRHSSFGEKADPFLETSSPRILRNDRRDNNSSFDPTDSKDTKKKVCDQ